MKKWMIPTVLAVLVASPMMMAQKAWAEEDEIAKEETAAESVKDRPEWTGALKTKYNLTDEQIQSMKAQGLNYPQMAMTSALAEKSGKSIDEVIKMRTEGKMGWGKIAKELGVPPKEIGHSVSSLRHEIRDERREAREKRREGRQNKREERRAARAEKKERKNH